jgi:deoxyinosine 3'endonuclease (endonuclease V)
MGSPVPWGIVNRNQGLTRMHEGVHSRMHTLVISKKPSDFSYVQATLRGYRLPEPTRPAHNTAALAED